MSAAFDPDESETTRYRSARRKPRAHIGLEPGPATLFKVADPRLGKGLGPAEARRESSSQGNSTENETVQEPERATSPEKGSSAQRNQGHKLRSEVQPARTNESEGQGRAGRRRSVADLPSPSRRSGRHASEPRPPATTQGWRSEPRPDWQGALMNECTSCRGTSSSSPAIPGPKPTGGASLPALTCQQRSVREGVGGRDAGQTANELTPPRPTVTHRLLRRPGTRSSPKRGAPRGRP